MARDVSATAAAIAPPWASSALTSTSVSTMLASSAPPLATSRIVWRRSERKMKPQAIVRKVAASAIAWIWRTGPAGAPEGPASTRTTHGALSATPRASPTPAITERSTTRAVA